MLINLKDETLEILNKHGKTWDDVEWWAIYGRM